MVSLSNLFFCLSVDAALHLAGAVPCTADSPIMDDACSEIQESPMYLQIAKNAKPAEESREHKDVEAHLQEKASPLVKVVTKIRPIDCKKVPKPIQVLKEGNGFAFKTLNVDTGVYTTLFDIPFDVVFPKYKDLNSCGINPVDSIPYCTLWSSNNLNYLVRVGPKKIEYVAKLPTPPRRFYNSGAFSPDGTFYIADEKANFLVFKSVNTIAGVAKLFSRTLTDWSKAKITKPKGFKSAADMVIVKKDLGKGEKEYVIVLNQGKLAVAQSDGDGGFPETSIRDYMMGAKKGTARDKFGAGWSFSGKVFFAHNSGAGVFQVDLAQIQLKLKPRTFTLKKIGKSSKTGFNDGCNCMKAPDPWKTGVVPIDCDIHGTPMQSVRVPGRGYVIHKPNFDTGAYDVAFQLPFSKTTPPYKYLNAIGINPEDSIAYGCMLLTEPHQAFYIVRFDGMGFEFVYKVLDKQDPIAGTFDDVGNFYWMHNTNGSYNPVLFRISGLSDLKGFKSPNEKKLPVMSNLDGLILWRYHQFADLAWVKYDLDGSGRKEDYIVAINDERQGVFIDWDEKNASKSKVSQFSFPNPWGTGKQLHNFGAAWNYKGQLYFAANEGFGVLRMDKVDFAKGTMKLTKLGKSLAVVNTDGFNCWVK